MGFRVEGLGLGFRVEGLGLGVRAQGLGFGFRVQGLGLATGGVRSNSTLVALGAKGLGFGL